MLSKNLSPVVGVAVGVPIVTVTGRGQVHIENHRGLIGYSTEEVSLNAGRLIIRLRGTNLELKDMSDLELIVTGTVSSIEYLE